MSDNVGNPNVSRLRATLADLENELQGVEELDPETRAMLESAVEEIQGTLGSQALPATQQPASLGEGLREAARGFESSHPTLAQMVHRVVDALSNLGI